MDDLKKNDNNEKQILSKNDEVVENKDSETKQEIRQDIQATGEEIKNSDKEAKIQELASTKSRAQIRIEKLIQEKKELQKTIDSFKKSEKPNADQYEDEDQYEIDKTVYIQEQAELKRKRKELENLSTQSEQEKKAYYQQCSDNFVQKVQKYANKDFILQNNMNFDGSRNMDVQLEVMNSPYAPEIFEVILKDVNRFNAMSDHKFIKEVAKIEAKFENASKPLKPVESVANPPTILDGGDSSNITGKKDAPLWTQMSYTQLKRYKG